MLLAERLLAILVQRGPSHGRVVLTAEEIEEAGTLPLFVTQTDTGDVIIATTEPPAER